MFYGQGTFTTFEGNKFVGEMKDNKPLNGILYDKDGKIIKKVGTGEKKHLKQYSRTVEAPPPIALKLPMK